MKKYKIDIEANVSGSDDLEKLDQLLESIDDNAAKATTGVKGLDTALDGLSTSAGSAADSVEDVGDASKKTSDELTKMGKSSKVAGSDTAKATSGMGAGFERLQDQTQLAATGLRNIQQEARSTQTGVRATAGDAAGAIAGIGAAAKDTTDAVEEGADAQIKANKGIATSFKERLAARGDAFAELIQQDKEEKARIDELSIKLAGLTDLTVEYILVKKELLALAQQNQQTEIKLADATQVYTDALEGSIKLTNEEIQALKDLEEAEKSAADAATEVADATKEVGDASEQATSGTDELADSLDDSNKSLKLSETSLGKVGASLAGAFGGAAFALVNRVVDALINIPPVTEALEKAFKGITTTVEAMTGKWDDLYESVTNTEAGFWDFIAVAQAAIKAMKDLQYQMVINESLTASNARAVSALNDNAERTTKIWQDETLELGKRTTALNQWKAAQLEAIKLEQQAVDRQLAIKQRELLFTGLIKEREELEKSIDYWQNYYDAAGIVDDPNARPILAGLLERLQEMEVIMGPINTEIQSLLLAQDDLNRKSRDVKEQDLTISPITDDSTVDNDLESWKRYNLQRLLLEQEFNEKINLLNQDDELGRLDVQEEFLIRAKKLKEDFLKSELYILELRGLKYTEEYEKLSDELLDVERDYTVEFINIQNARAAEEARLRAEKLEEEQLLLEEQKRLAQEEFDYRRMLFGEMINLMGEIGLERIGIFADMMDILWVEAVEDGVSSIMKITELSTAEIGVLIGTAFRGVAQLMTFIADAFDESTREGFEKQKKARIGGAIMDSFGAAIAGLLAGLEAGGPWGIALGIATAASSLAFGLVQVDKIRKTTFDGGGDSGGGGIGPQSSIISPYEDGGKKSSPADPNVLKQGAGNLPPVQAQVVGETVTTQQAIERQTTKNASF